MNSPVHSALHAVFVTLEAPKTVVYDTYYYFLALIRGLYTLLGLFVLGPTRLQPPESDQRLGGLLLYFEVLFIDVTYHTCL